MSENVVKNIPAGELENAQWNNQPKEITPVYGSTKQQQESDDTNKQEFMCYNWDLFRYLEPYHQMLF